MVATNPMEIVKIRMQMQALLPPEQRQTTMQVKDDMHMPSPIKRLLYPVPPLQGYDCAGLRLSLSVLCVDAICI